MMAVVGWVDTETDIEGWADAPADDAELARLLRASYEQCVQFLPHVGGVPQVPEDVPARLVQAQIMQARALYRSTLAGAGDQIGADGMAVTVFPMDWTVKNLLRPKRVGRVL